MANELTFKGMGVLPVKLTYDLPPMGMAISGVADLGGGKIALFPLERAVSDGAAQSTISIRVVDLKVDPTKVIHTQEYTPVTTRQPDWVPQGNGREPQMSDQMFALSTEYMGNGTSVVLWGSGSGYWTQMTVIRWNGSSVEIGPPVIISDPNTDPGGIGNDNEVLIGAWGRNLIYRYLDDFSGDNVAGTHRFNLMLVRNGSGVILALTKTTGSGNIQTFRHFKIKGMTIATDGDWKWPKGPSVHRSGDRDGQSGPSAVMNGRWLSMFAVSTAGWDGETRIMMSRCNIDTLEVVNQVITDGLSWRGDVLQPERAGAAGVYIGAARVSRDFKVSGRYNMDSMWPQRRSDPHMKDPWLPSTGETGDLAPDHARRDGSAHSGTANGSAMMLHYPQYGGGSAGPGEPYSPPGHGHQSGWAIFCQLGRQNGYGELAVAPNRGTYRGEGWGRPEKGQGWEYNIGIDSYLVTDTHIIGFCNRADAYGYYRPIDFDPAYYYLTYYVFSRPSNIGDISPGKNAKQGYFS